MARKGPRKSRSPWPGSSTRRISPAGCTRPHRASLWRLEVLANRDAVAARVVQVAQDLLHLLVALAQTQHDRGFRLDAVKALCHPEQAKGEIVVAARAGDWIERGDRLDVVGEDEGQGVLEDIQRLFLAIPEIRREDLESHGRALPPHFVDTVAEMAGPAIRQIIAIDAGNDQVLDVHLPGHLGPIGPAPSGPAARACPSPRNRIRNSACRRCPGSERSPSPGPSIRRGSGSSHSCRSSPGAATAAFRWYAESCARPARAASATAVVFPHRGLMALLSWSVPAR